MAAARFAMRVERIHWSGCTADDEEAKKKLVEAERLWAKFRDAECESVADDFRGVPR